MLRILSPEAKVAFVYPAYSASSRFSDIIAVCDVVGCWH